ncbi:MAG: hypothetical protein ACKVY0_04685 [Prosthecobacter sp.]
MKFIPCEATAGGKLAAALKQFFPQDLFLTHEAVELRLCAGRNTL